jgi:hypothetical protein
MRAHLEWQQRHYPAIIRSLDGKLASGWFSTTEHTQPTLIKKTFQVHEIGYLWNEVEKRSAARLRSPLPGLLRRHLCRR